MKYLILLLLPFSASAQGGSEIYLFDLSVNNNTITISNAKNITNHKGYDNQPRFHPEKPIVYYSSAVDSSRTDIFSFNYVTNTSENISDFPERKYSPTVTPDKSFLSAILLRNSGVQDLIKFAGKGARPAIIVGDLKVGYHVWMNNNRLLLFVLKNDSLNQLHDYNLLTKENKVIIDNPGRSLHQIPGENAFSFVQKSRTEKWQLKRYDPVTAKTSLITELAKVEDVAWTANGTVLVTEDDHILTFDPKQNKWGRVNIDGDMAFLKKLTRLAVSADGKKLAVVVAE